MWGVLSWLAAGVREEQIIEDYLELEKDDFQAPEISCGSTTTTIPDRQESGRVPFGLLLQPKGDGGSGARG